MQLYFCILSDELLGENMVRKSPKRIIMDVEERLHAEVKKRAAEGYCTMNQWLLQAILDKIIKEDRLNLYK